MNARAIIVRETLVSIAINAVISLAFFFGVFGLGAPIALNAFGPDFLPQSFMVALMGCLVPGVLVSRRSGGRALPAAARALALAIVALGVAGGGALLVCRGIGGTIAALPALIVKVAFGAALAAITTPFAVAGALRPAAALPGA